MRTETTAALVSLGGNLGDVPRTFADAIRLLNASPVVRSLRVSGCYATTPIGTAAGATFLNAALVADVTCLPREFLAILQQIESALGRTREIRWEPRRLDLDIIGFGAEVVDTADLTIPHPACWYRRFVLDPVCDVAPDWEHPLLKEPVRRLRERLLPRPLPVQVLDDAEQKTALCADVLRAELRSAFTDAEITLLQPRREEDVHRVTGAGGASDPDDSPALTLSLAVGSQPRVIVLAGRTAPVEFAIQAVRAALDCPVPRTCDGLDV